MRALTVNVAALHCYRVLDALEEAIGLNWLFLCKVFSELFPFVNNLTFYFFQREYAFAVISLSQLLI